MLWNSYPRDVVHEFWGRFPPQHPLISDGFGLLFFFLWMMSTFGNGLVIYIFLSTKTLRTAVSNNSVILIKISNPMMYGLFQLHPYCNLKCCFRATFSLWIWPFPTWWWWPLRPCQLGSMRLQATLGSGALSAANSMPASEEFSVICLDS